MTRYIRKPLTTLDWKDFITWEKVKSEPIQQEIGLQDKIKIRKDKKLAKARADWKVFINWLWWVTL